MKILLRALAALVGLLCTDVYAGNLKVTLTPSQAVSAGAQWRVDGGTWRNSGTTVSNLSNTTHVVSYKATSGWVTPANASVTLANGVTTSLTGAYVATASLKINLTPSTGKWRVDSGTWQNSGATVSGLAPGSHAVDYQAVSGYVSPATETATLTSGQTTTLTRSYTQLASLKITLTPTTGKWRVDNGTWQSSGATVSGLTPGNHAVDYQAVSGYVSPAAETAVLISGQTTTLARSYTQLAALTVTLTPSSAQWRVDGGAWRNSGTTATSLPPGNHTVDYSAVTGYTTPASETVTLTAGQAGALSRTYAQLAAVTVPLTPSSGQWRVDSGAWRASGTTATNLAPGSHVLDFSPLAGYVTPSSQTVTLTAGQTLVFPRTYNALAQLTINLTPATGQWRINGGPWRASGSTATGVNYGTIQLDYSPLAGYSVPPLEILPLAPGEMAVIERSYVHLAQLTVTLSPASAQWRVDGGAWRNSGTTHATVPPGSHVIDYSTLAGYVTPASESISLSGGQQASVNRNYAELASLSVVLDPTQAQWRIDGGGWNASGATVTNLALGTHTIGYAPVAGYTTPGTETVLLASGQNPTLVRAYGAPQGSLSISLSPAEGQWRIDGGTWQASGATHPGINAGNHTVDYSPLPAYIPPAMEVVTILPNATATLARTYAVPADLLVTTNPTSAARVGAVWWRADGGSWFPPGSPVTLSAGTHTVEFQPTAGWIVPAATTVTLAPGANTLTADYHPVHRLRYFLHQDLVGSLSLTELQARISQHAAHVREIFHRETVRRFTFDPQTDITICTASPFSNSYPGPPPEIGYEVWIYVQLTDNPSYGTYGGTASLDQSGAGGATGLKWDAIHDPAILQADTPELRQYWTQVDHTVHELEHAFGAGIGEYYSAGYLVDPTDVAPLLATTTFIQPDPSDQFWGSRPEYWTDPLTVNIYDHWRAGNPTSLPLLLETTTFAPTTAAVIASLHRYTTIETLPDLSAVRVNVIDATTGQLIPGATLRVWNRRNYNANFEHPVSPGALPGAFTFTWDPYPSISVFGSYDNMKILKAWAPGYAPKAQWEWIYDANKVKLVEGANVLQLTIALTPQ